MSTTNNNSLLDKDSNSTILDNNSFIYNSNEKLSISQQRISLPIYQYRKHILYLLENYSTLVIVGYTGCGKSTQIPQYLYESGFTDGFRSVVCTQPRRVAAISLAERVSFEITEKEGQVGKVVGYSVRFDEKISDLETRIKYVTDGMLIREMMLDPLLLKYSVIMIDEAHERSLSTDILIGLLKKVQKKRNSTPQSYEELKLVISSATINAIELFNFFNENHTNDKSKDTASILSIEGKTFPVDIHYLETPSSNYIQQTLQTIIDIHITQPPGDILVFLTGQDEIEKMILSLDDKLELLRQQQQSKMMKYSILPMYSGLSINKQIKVFEPSKNSNTRKIILSTNIAETSITINGIVYVVDCGFVKIKSYNPKTGLESLVVIPTSKSSANQRAGRAGRNRYGKCYRLYTEDTFKNQLLDQSIPEIQRTNLTSMILQLKAMGIDNILNFDFLTQPPTISLIKSLEILYGLGALDLDGKLTIGNGVIMAEFPTDPAYTKCILYSSNLGCSEELITITSMLTVQGLFVNQNHKSRKHMIVKEGDHLTLLNIYNSFTSQKQQQAPSWCHQHQINYKAMQRVLQVRKQLLAYAKKYSIKLVSCLSDNKSGGSSDPSISIRKSLVSGFFTNAAQLQPDGSYLTIREKHKLMLHPTSVLCLTSNSPQWVIFNDSVSNYMKEVTQIEPNWLYEISPHYYKFKN